MCLWELDGHSLFLKPSAKDPTYRCMFMPTVKRAFVKYQALAVLMLF